MSSDDLAQARLSAAVLSSCRWLCWPSPVLLLALALLKGGAVWLPACALAALWQAWLNWRLQLDAGMLRAMNGEAGLAQLDTVLARLFGKKNGAGRSLEERQRGMAGLLRRALIATALCWGLCLAGLAYCAW
ncbi:hypothetical protein [Chromobacterium sp. IIBBL 290-4]|uniref:hypothetical protein n=1 Tax=Chromobacterium sp. IIBBL 290-4 TaxID=2953890 RepID=UPI0020B72CFE|nr:hypothetical protein [Chromobacterium sp. IIBBL 290-4]UTH74808.1 hypothetical protein NKT35_01490 [Chromobacterium sp. IIBBL 290-4]